jgi:hypothetical protein
MGSQQPPRAIAPKPGESVIRTHISFHPRLQKAFSACLECRKQSTTLNIAQSQQSTSQGLPEKVGVDPPQSAPNATPVLITYNIGGGRKRLYFFWRVVRGLCARRAALRLRSLLE